MKRNNTYKYQSMKPITIGLIQAYLIIKKAQDKKDDAIAKKVSDIVIDTFLNNNEDNTVTKNIKIPKYIVDKY